MGYYKNMRDKREKIAFEILELLTPLEKNDKAYFDKIKLLLLQMI